MTKKFLHLHCCLKHAAPYQNPCTIPQGLLSETFWFLCAKVLKEAFYSRNKPYSTRVGYSVSNGTGFCLILCSVVHIFRAAGTAGKATELECASTIPVDA